MAQADRAPLAEGRTVLAGAHARPDEHGPLARTAALVVLAGVLVGICATAYAGLRGNGARSSPTPVSRPSSDVPHATAWTAAPNATPSALPTKPVAPATAATLITRPETATTKPTVPKATTAPTWQTKTITGTRVLTAGRSWSTNRLRLTLAGNGNLTLTDQGKQIWQTGTAGRGGIQLVMQDDGNLVLYDGASATLWSTRTDGHPGAALVLGADGTMTIALRERTLWSAR